MINLLKGLPDYNVRIRLSSDFQADLLWWKHFAEIFNGKATLIPFNFGEGPKFYTDASLSGYGMVCNRDWMGGFFNMNLVPILANGSDPCHGHWMNVCLDCFPVSDVNINFLELIAVWLAIRRLAPQYTNKHLLCYTDNTQVQFMINKGTSSNISCMSILREIFWICVRFNCFITARHIKGSLNLIPDRLSRLDPADHDLHMDCCLCCSGR
jgi:hypothetical protein